MRQSLTAAAPMPVTNTVGAVASREEAKESIRNMGRMLRDQGVPANERGHYIVRLGSGQRFEYDPVFDTVTPIVEADRPNRKTRRAQSAVIRVELAKRRKFVDAKRARLKAKAAATMAQLAAVAETAGVAETS